MPKSQRTPASSNMRTIRSVFVMIGSSSDPHGVHDVLDRANDGERGQFSGFGIFARHIFNVDMKPAELPFNVNVMKIALKAGHGQDAYECVVGADPRRARCGGYII